MPRAPKYIELTQGQRTLVDAEDYENLSKVKWYALKSKSGWRAARRAPGKKSGTLLMPRVILGVTDPALKVDHRNHNTLDNRRSNLRIATASQNSYNYKKPVTNKSGYKGVSRSGKPNKPWRAIIYADKRGHSLGYYTTPEQAAEAYRKAAIYYHKEFAYFK